MQATYAEHSRMAATFTKLASLCAVVLMGVVLAYWTWVWLAPAPGARAAAPPQAAGPAAPTAGAYAMFGNVSSGSAGSARPPDSLTLLGVVASSGGLAAYAVIRSDARQSITVRAGEDAGPGLRLVEVHADRIVLSRSGVRETLLLPQPGPLARTATPAPGK